MLVRPHAHQEWELLKWMMLLTLAAALTLVFAGVIGGAAELMPRDHPPLPTSQIIMGDLSFEPVEDSRPVRSPDLASRIWQAIRAQREEDYPRAIEMWNAIDMPCRSEHWKHVALGQAYVANCDLQPAGARLAMAAKLDPENPVVHYFLGLLRLERAHLDKLMDGPGRIVSVASGAPDAIENGYQLAAITDFEAAIKYRDTINRADPLVPDGWSAGADTSPTVQDLLLAVGADKFEATSHNILGRLYLDRHSLGAAEDHMDAAVSGGLPVLDGYSELGAEYEKTGQHGDALRVYLKAAREEPGKVSPLRNAWHSFLKSIL